MKTSALWLVLVLAAPLCGQESKPAKSEIDVLYAEDQADRTGFGSQTFTADSVKRLMERDAAHTKRVHELLAAGALTTGQDFEKAAFIFQHGNEAGDQLLAHVLAMVAVSKGDEGAIWIAAATLDRYLQRIGQPQVLGTQSGRRESQPWTQEPYDRTLIPDSLRMELHVPSLEEQAKHLSEKNQAQPAK